ncbi:TEA/ATTS domain family-domain-containing protein [Gilbertella persicaria]|uniref:TEA/ATTS domain family-domain-containing protein n=1 Tax=Gilbertella persicaria TaxID=101096 RepID=UPI00221E462C|nr:TEA/ATTS domain family-domain-containing protein [Gilbertella persicaria]KAI8079637.1 TEA/ATTS domain family-domain-containing protein [Gilbertella persicaria]
MLACPQDLFFHNGNYQKVIHNQALLMDKDKKIKQRKDSMKEFDLHGNDLSSSAGLKDKEEQVWPPDVESAFIEALESIPKLGRRKILVNGKPCGRNELISDYIYRKTCKVRTRKQVSSHIQVLKNTRKGDSHFMRLLTDSVDVDDSNATTNSTTANTSRNNLKRPRNTMHHHHHHHARPHRSHPYHHPGKAMLNNPKYLQDSSDESSINSSPSPTDYVFDIMYGDPSQQQALSMLQFKDFYDPFQQSVFNHDMVSQNLDALNLDTKLITDPFFGSENMFSSNDFFTSNMLNPLEDNDALVPNTLTEEEMLMNSLTMLTNKTKAPRMKSIKRNAEDSNDMEYALWPNYLCLYLEYALPYDPACRVLSHNLSQLPHCHSNSLMNSSCSDAIAKEKCPPITSLTQDSDPYALLLAKTKLDLNLSISDFTFNNTSFFETQTRRTIECTTTIYSFGNVVLESKEVQQALWVNEGKYMYSFVFVNQFFDAFMKGIRSLQSWDEVDIAINNLCIVQSFNDMDTTQSSSPLLVMIYEFERGDGTMEVINIEKKHTKAEPEGSLEFLDHDI